MRGEFFAPTQSNTLNIADLARVLLANVWQIACVTVTVVIATLLYAYSETPLYQGTATILLEPRLNRAVHLREVYDPGVETDSYYATQVEILRSRHLAQRVVDKLGLNRFDESAQPTQDVPPAVTTSWNQWLPRSVAEFIGFPVPPSQEISRTAQSVNRSAVNELTRETHVEPVPRTQLLRVHYLSASPQEAARRANALADAYIEIGLESRLEASRRATAWLTGKLDELRVSLEKAERGLQQFREREQLVDVGGVRALVEEELLDNSRRLREAQKTTNALAATYAQVRQAGTDPARLEQIGDLIRLPLVENAKKAVVSAQENYKQLRQRYGEKHPLIAEAQTRLDSAQKTFRDQLLLAADNLRSEYEVAKQSQDAMGASVALAKSRIRDLDRKQYEFGVLQREVTSNQQLYNVFLSSFKETDSSSSFEPINARVLQVAEVPTKPVYPDYRLLTIKSAAAGLVLALLLVALRQMLDESIGSADELEAMADLSVMGVLPKAGGIGLRRNLVQHFVNEPRTAFAEGIRSVRAGLQLNDVDRRYRKVLVTSTVPGEGKSSLAACLALAIAPTDRVLLVECDLRAPCLKRIFGIAKTRPGIMEVLGGEAKLEDAVYVHEATGLHVLAVARRPANPSEVVGADALARSLQAWGQTYGRIIIDSPPLQAASDTLVLARLADAVLFTVKADQTRRKAVVNSVKQLRGIQATLLGAVINQVNPQRNPGYADYYYTKGYYG